MTMFMESSDIFLQLLAYRQVIGQITADHSPEIGTVVPHLDVAEFVDDDVGFTVIREVRRVCI